MKRINRVKIKLVKENCFLVKERRISEPKIAYQILSKYLNGADREYSVVLGLNTKNEVNVISTISIGSLNSTVIHPREVFKILIESNSASFILGHNHPSGDPSPSKEDINVTLRLKECGKIMGIELLDHIIVGDNTYKSLGKEGII